MGPSSAWRTTGSPPRHEKRDSLQLAFAGAPAERSEWVSNSMAGRSGSTIDLPTMARCVDLSPVRLYRKDSLQVVAPERRTSVMGMPSSTWRTEATPDAPPHG